MLIWKWFVQNWFDLLSAVGIVGSLLFTAVSLRSEAETRRVANLLTLTQNHREIWRDFYQSPHLQRVLQPAPDLGSRPVTQEEETFVNTVIQHAASVYRAMHSDLTLKPEGVRRDVGRLFALPIPRAVWDRIKLLQDSDFVAFVDGCVAEERSSTSRLGVTG